MEKQNTTENTKNNSESGSTLLGMIVLILIGVAVWHFWGGKKSIVGTWQYVGMQTDDGYKNEENDKLMISFHKDGTYVVIFNGMEDIGTYSYDNDELVTRQPGRYDTFVKCEIDGDKMILTTDGGSIECKRQ
ncbi:hypothetical protein [Hominisplanchenecus murintestinalis]|uniref:hypothetical protein n=1 Tax=Hominisplanchenecus murintestinalis TaxID=2941517 RepID=UPI00203C7A36|nr:hypothetical protein [Hominisplanchenecus murintestinalis]